MADTPDDALIVPDLLQHTAGLTPTEAWKKEARRQKARADFMAGQVASAWRETRAAIRERDAALGVECTVAYTHPHGPSCGRCGTRPDGTVG